MGIFFLLSSLSLKTIWVTPCLTAISDSFCILSRALSKFSSSENVQSIAIEFGSRGITVNCIAPGWIDTEMTVEISEDSKKDLLDKIPIRKIGKPEDIAYAAVFLASDEASYITGQTIVVDGGRVIN